jgi:putative aldouronate transport system substrate-binding protein
MKIKLIIAAIICLTMLVAGCQNSPTITATQESTSGNFPAATLTFYFPKLTSGEKTDTRLVLSELESKTADRLNIQLEFKWLPPNIYAQTIQARLSSGEELDAFYCGLPGQGLLDYTDLARDGLLADLSDALPAYAPGLVAQYDQNDLNCALVEDRLYAIPALFPMADNIYAIVRQDFMDSYGLPAIKTFADYDQYLAMIKENEPDTIPGRIADSTVALFARSSGYAIFDKDHFLVYGWDDKTMQIIPWEQTAEFRIVAGFLTDWARKGYLELAAKGAGDIWNAGDMIINGQISSFLFAGEYRIGETISLVEYTLNNFFISNNIPREIAAYRLYPDLVAQRLNPLGNGLTTGSLALSAKSEDIERTLMFLDWLQSSQENYDLIMYGIEGKHYQLNGDQLDFPEGITIDRNDWLGWDGRQAFKNLAYERFTAGSPAEAKELYAENIRFKSVLAPHDGFYADYARLTELLGLRKQLIISEIELPLLTGTFDLNDLDYLIEQLKKTGTDEIIADIQTQLTLFSTP